MKIKRLIVLTLGALLLFALGCEADKSNGGEGEKDSSPIYDDDDEVVTCTEDQECKQGQKCAGGICTTVECTSNAECDEGFLCKDYKCAPKSEGKPCSSHSECSGTRERCIENRCVEADCLSNKDCVKGFSCDPEKFACVEGIAEGSPCQEEAECADNQTCHENACIKTCMSNSDCKEGEICDQTSFGKMICMPDVECRVDSDCGQGKICKNNACEEYSGCLTSADCMEPAKPNCKAETGECVECLTTPDCKSAKKICNPSTNLCEEIDVGCKTNADCKDPSFPICDAASGQCKPKEAECKTDADCTNPLKPKCNVSLGMCVADSTGGCQSDSECTEAGKPLCHRQTGKCVQCLGDFDCDYQEKCNSQFACEYVSSGDDCPQGTTCQSSTWGAACLNNLGQVTAETEKCDANKNCPDGKTRFDQASSFGDPVCYCPKKCVVVTGECAPCGFPPACNTGLECSSMFMGGVCQRPCKSDADCTNPIAPKCGLNKMCGCTGQ